MSIKISHKNCRGCGKCIEVCPGNLLANDETGKAYIRYPKDCWGCTACLKECQAGAIRYFLGPDIGGRGTYLYTVKSKDCLAWHFVSPNTEEKVISVKQNEANKY